jgi:CarboxypepD_reg-like domain/TonB-dependent Receptor Plug Domain
MHRIFAITLLIMTVSLPAFSQSNLLTQTVKGKITDTQSGAALSDATITIEGENNKTVLADKNGDFKIEKVSIGRKTIRISLIGYEDAVISNIEVTSSKEVVLEIKLIENIKKLDEVVIKAGKPKNRALNEAAVVSARQFSVDEAVRYSGTRNDPSRMAQNFAGVSGGNDARNDIIIRGNSPSGVLWRMDGIDIPNPNHYSTLGSTGGPVTILNTNTLKNSDFITSAFPAQYGNAIAGVFDLNMRNGNNEKYEFLGQLGFNGFEFGAEGPLSKKNKSSFLINYRYSLVAVIQKVGLNVGTGSATPYYQDINFKLNIPTKKAGVFSVFGLGGESHIKFEAADDDNLYSTNDGSLRERTFNSVTGVVGLTHTYFFNPNTSGKIILAASGLGSKYREDFYNSTRIDKTAFYKKNTQLKYTAGYILNKKINAKNRITTGVTADINKLKLRNDYIPDGDSVLFTFFDTNRNTALIRSFINYTYRFSDKISTNIGLYYQVFTLNNSMSLEPRMNIRYQLSKNQSLSFGAGLHSQVQPLEVYFYKTKSGDDDLSNKELKMVKTTHAVLGYDINFSKTLRLKTEIYGQYIFNAAVEKNASSFSMLNAGADFYFPDKTNLVNNGKGYNYGAELTIEKFLEKGFYYLVTASLFQSQYKGSDNVWRNTAFNSNFAVNLLAGKEFAINTRSSFGVDTKLTSAGGQRYSPFNITASEAAGYVVFKESEAYSLQHSNYLRWDLKFSYTKNGRKATQKWYVDLQNLSNRNNVYIRTLNPKSGKESIINQIGFFPNINYSITF